MDDSAIVELFMQRSEDALTQCELKYGAYCRSVAMNIVRSGEDAEECVNDTLRRAWNAIPPARPNRLKAFLGKVARNLALDRYEAARAQKRGGSAVELALDELADLAVPESADEGEITRVINEFLRSEPTEHSNIFVKRYWYLQEIRQIATETAYSQSKVTSLLFRMRGRLKTRLESEGLM